MKVYYSFKFLIALAILASQVQYAAQYKATTHPTPQSGSPARLTKSELGAIKILRTIHSAEVSYQATTGNGKYGSLNELTSTGLLSKELVRGPRNGYQFRLRLRNTPGTSPSLIIIATPNLQGRTFAIDESGVIRFSTLRTRRLSTMRLLVDEGGGIAANEISAVTSLRQIFTSEATYQATAGNGNYGRLDELHKEQLLDKVLAAGRKNGYRFKIRVEKASPESRSFFEAVAVPVIYKKTGTMSFFIDDSGVIRAADKRGAEASGDDAAINN